jgi:hypothetical protein
LFFGPYEISPRAAAAQAQSSGLPTVTSLNLGELWALPIMLRLALIENLRRVATRIASDTIDRNRGDY